jgi:hypothetical protein
MAYYLNDKGMSEFELHSYNLRQELTRQRELFKRVPSPRLSMNRLIFLSIASYSACSHLLSLKRGR